MPIFIKPGFWRNTTKGFKDWLNLSSLILNTGSFPTIQNETQVFNNVTAAGIFIYGQFNVYSRHLSFPNLTTVIDEIYISGDASYDYWNIQSIDFPNLEHCQKVQIETNYALQNITLPKLKGDDLVISLNNNLQQNCVDSLLKSFLENQITYSSIMLSGRNDPPSEYAYTNYVLPLIALGNTLITNF